jgi:hypothetical protein
MFARSQGGTGEVSLTNYDRQEGREVLGDGPVSSFGILVVGFSGSVGTEPETSADVRISFRARIYVYRVDVSTEKELV